MIAHSYVVVNSFFKKIYKTAEKINIGHNPRCQARIMTFFALSRYSVFFAVEQALSEAVADNGKVIDMHLPVFEFERERIGVSLHRDKIRNIKALLLAEHGRIDIYPLARSHDLLVELAEHRRGTEKHTAKTRDRNEALAVSERGDGD